MLSLNAMAYDFSYTHQGNTLYYNITSDNTVEVTYHGNINYVSGDVVIPSSVTNNGTTYSVTSIGNSAFWRCSGLTSVTIPNSVTSIGNHVFRGCSGLTSVTIPNSVTSIGNSAFRGCSSLSSVTIPNSVTSIGNSAFSACSSLTSVTIPNSVTSIGADAFRACSSLTSVIIPNSVTSIGNYAFCECSSLSSVTIPNSVTSIGVGVFFGCSSLTSITIPNSVTLIGEGAFAGCSSLTTLNFNAINCNDFASGNGYQFYSCPLISINIGDSVQRIPAYFAKNQSGLISITIPDNVTEIGSSAFQGCSGLIAVIIGNGVNNIYSSSFRGCTNLTYLTIGSSVENIGDSAFIDCNILTSITSKATTPPEIASSNVFPYPNECSVTVPCGSLGAYTDQMNRWYLLFNPRIEEDCSSALQEVESTREFVVYPNPARGFAIVEFETLQERSLLIIADLGGRVIKTFDLSAGTESVRLDLRDLPSGVYTLMIGNTTKKLIVE